MKRKVLVVKVVLIMKWFWKFLFDFLIFLLVEIKFVGRIFFFIGVFIFDVFKVGYGVVFDVDLDNIFVLFLLVLFLKVLIF